RARMGPRRRVGDLRLAPIPDATLQWILPQLDVTERRRVVVHSVQAEVRRQSVVSPPGMMRTLAIDGKCLGSGRRGGGPRCQGQGEGWVPRARRGLLTGTYPRLFIDQRSLAAEQHEMGAFAAFWAQLLQP